MNGNQGNLLLLMFNPGDRVQAHPATNSWMMGDRFGTVKTVGHKYVHVLMDRSGEVKKFAPENLLQMEEK